jgi:hypothetical protein
MSCKLIISPAAKFSLMSSSLTLRAEPCRNPLRIMLKCIECRNYKTVVKDRRATKCRPSVVNGDLVQSADQKMFERLHLNISEIACEFPQIALTVFYEIIK